MGVQRPDSDIKQNYEKFENDITPLEAKEEKDPKNQKCSPQDGFKLIVAGCVLFGLSLTAGVIIDTFMKKPPSGHGGVASDSQDCSNIGLEILHQGGSAVDAAVASMICLTVVRPGSTGLSSGGYMLLHTPKGQDVTIDFQFVAPASASKDMFNKDKSKSERGGLAVAIPGLLRGLELAHKKYGKLSWSSLVSPTVKLSEKGIKMDKMTVDAISNSLPIFTNDLKRAYAPNGKIPKVGDTIINNNLTKLLGKISSQGADAFYTGMTATNIVDVINASGGNFTKDDLKNYAAVEAACYFTEYRGYKVISTPPPSSGAVVLAAMNLMNQLKLSAANQKKSLNYHYLAETFKFVFAERTRMGDPKFEKDVNNIIKEMMSSAKAVELSRKISENQTYPAAHYGPFFSSAKTKGTANVVVLGTNGDLVSVISTIGSSFGSKIITKTGIVLNNGMSSFSSPGFNDRDGIPPSKANYIKPGKRPLSAAAPVIAFNKKKPCSDQYVIGSSGGAKSITATIQVLIDLLYYHNSIENAVGNPRIHTQLVPDAVLAEGKKFRKAHMESVLTDLKGMGHKIDSSVEKLGSVNLISQQSKKIATFADENNDGGSVRF